MASGVVAVTDSLHYNDYVTAESERAEIYSSARFNNLNIHDVIEMINLVVGHEAGVSSNDYKIVEWNPHERLPSITAQVLFAAGLMINLSYLRLMLTRGSAQITNNL